MRAWKRCAGRLAALLVISSILLLSCPSPVGGPASEAPGNDDPAPETPSPSDALSLSISGEIHGLSVGIETLGPIVLGRTEDQVLAAVQDTSAAQDRLRYRPFSTEEWLTHKLPSNADGLVAVHCDPDAIYTAAGRSILRGDPSRGDFKEFVVFGSGQDETIEAILVHGDELFIGTRTGAFRMSVADLETANSASPTRFSEATVRVSSFAVVGDLLFVGTRPGDKKPVDPKSGALYTYTWTAETPKWEPDKVLIGAIFDIAEIGGLLYIGSNRGLYVRRSSDGVVYDPVDLAPAPGSSQPEVRNLSYDTDTGIVYAATSDGLWYSLDGGSLWSFFDPGDGLPDAYEGRGFHSVTGIGDRVYLATEGVGVLELVWE